jgi:hypothetical protein
MKTTVNSLNLHMNIVIRRTKHLLLAIKNFFWYISGTFILYVALICHISTRKVQ